MFYVFERIMYSASKPSTISSKSCIYEERIKCFQKLAEIQMNLQLADKEYHTTLSIEEKAHENTYNLMETYTKQYKNEYELCEKIMKY